MPDGVVYIHSKITCLYHENKSAYISQTSENAGADRRKAEKDEQLMTMY
jgi:hypothetical protein